MPTKKCKAQCAGLKEGRYGGAKKPKANKENFSVYIATLPSDSKDGLDTTFSSLPIHRTHSIPTAPGNGPEAPPLCPSSCTDSNDILPDFEPVSDDEDEQEDDIQADDEGDDDPDDPDDNWNNTPGVWDNYIYAEAYHNLSVPNPAAASAPEPTSTAAPQNDALPADSWSNDFADSMDNAHSDEEVEPDEGQPDNDTKDGKFTAPSIKEAKAVLKAINALLHPHCNTRAGYKKCNLPLYTHTRLEWMASFLHLYTSSNRPVPGQQPVNLKWISASLAAAHAAQKGLWTARKLQEWTCTFMKDPKDLLTSPYGSWSREHSVLEDADVANEIALHLQSLGKYVRALNIMHYIDQVKSCLALKKGIHLVTVQ
ncbi:hypothetical protein MVEN_02168900 [Mycena venus]|uniref:Uncharacterized protein n=1 Tax=Mycena venus TaxID=2733690 RepID=A0A8H6X911_9AGAR|nr:hypothetical protein MVEN_02168900 [Mycena venus]